VNEFDTSSLFSEFSEVTDSYGNVFVRIPRIYIKKVDTAGHKAWYASRRPFTGAYLPKCFWDFTNSRELDYIDVGKYKASLSDDSLRLESKPDKFPLSNKNIVQFRDYAKANNTDVLKGYQQLDIHTVDLLQTLFIIEQATINSQSKVAGYTSGQYSASHVATVAETDVNRIIIANAYAALYSVGQTIGIGTSLGGNQIAYNRVITSIDTYDASNMAITFDGAVVDIAVGNIVYNMGYKNGFSSGIAASVGSLNSNSNGKYPFVWHGIESLYGDMWQFVDGININENQAWVCPNADSYASNVFASPYEQVGYVNASADGYVKATGHDVSHPYCEIPVDTTGSSSTYYSDYYYQSAGQRIARFGGRWSDSSNAGLFCWSLLYSSSASSLYIGGRLLKKAL
jgi:hypothetical protein